MKFGNSKFETGNPPEGWESEGQIRICRNAAGFTLVEVIIIIVMVSVFVAAIGIPLLNSLRESDLPEIATVAYFLALEKLEELTPITTGSISKESKAPVSGYDNYQRQVAVCDVNCDTLTITTPPECDPCSDPDCVHSPYPEQGSNCRKITVTVYHARMPNGVSLVTLRTAY